MTYRMQQYSLKADIFLLNTCERMCRNVKIYGSMADTINGWLEFTLILCVGFANLSFCLLLGECDVRTLRNETLKVAAYKSVYPR